MIHIYCGSGKGKSTAALGLCFRAAGQGIRPCVFSFLKDGSAGEAMLAKELSCMDMLCCQTKVQGFFWEMSSKEKMLLSTETKQGFFKAQACAQSGKYGLLVLDEIGGCLENGLLTETDVHAFLQAFGTKLELVLTGRTFPPTILDAADYVSEIMERKHPMTKGVPARKGIEY